jgi:ActR/RegA family two-component response regulator
MIYFFSLTRSPAWAGRTFADLTEGLCELAAHPPAAVVVDLQSTSDVALRAVRRAWNGPLVVLGTGSAACRAIKEGGADDYAASPEDVLGVVEGSRRRHENRSCAQELCRKIGVLSAPAGRPAWA